MPTNLPNPGAIAEGLQGQLGSLATSSGALTALGQLGEQNGTSEQVKSLAAKLVTDNQSLTGKLQQAGSAAGITLPDAATPELQKTLDELKQKSGPEFDQAWLQAVQGEGQNAQSAAEGVAGAQGVPPEVAAAAQGAADQLKAGQEQATQAAGALGGAAGQAGDPAGGPAGAGQGGTGQDGTGQDGAGQGGDGTSGTGQGGAVQGGGGTSGTGAGGAGSGAAPEAGKPYTVQSGDTLSSIAQRVYGNPRDEQKIAEANNIGDHDVILPGQVINLP